ncbi:MAG TPA: hypothetical protein VG757_10875 [Devosia sp.]|nr:hypothetical protein [Devosia sp.]
MVKIYCPPGFQQREGAFEMRRHVIGMEMFDHLRWDDVVVGSALLEIGQMDAVRHMPFDAVHVALAALTGDFSGHAGPSIFGEEGGEYAHARAYVDRPGGRCDQPEEVAVFQRRRVALADRRRGKPGQIPVERIVALGPNAPAFALP